MVFLPPWFESVFNPNPLSPMRSLAFIVMLAGTLTCAARAESPWQLVWSDEFDYEGLPDPKKWGYEEGFIRNQESQYYTKERAENARVTKGVLVIEGRKERFKNPRHKPGSAKWNEQREAAAYTSASINTLGKAAFHYGRVEVRAKLPQGKGMWPAIWMMGTNHPEVGWPRCGEIDIMEYVGKMPDTIHANNHFANPSIKHQTVHQSAGGGKLTLSQPYKDFHIYTIEWDPDAIRFFVDDKPYAKLLIDTAGKGPDNPFRKPHYLLLNLALGGNWGGEIDDTMLPQKYEIDYVRIYKAKPGTPPQR